MNKFGFQTQRGDPPQYNHIDWSRVAVAKFFGNALNHDMIAAVRVANPNTFIVLRPNVGDWYVDKQWTLDAANTAAGQLTPFLQAGLCDAVESPNEPVVQTVDAAKLLSDCQVAYSEFMHARGFKQVIAYNFSVGNPSYDLWPHLLGGLRASEFLGLHQYGYSYAPFTLQSHAGDYALRHRKVWPLLPADARRKILITECGVDTRNGGYRSAPFTFSQYADMLKWWAGELAHDTYVGGFALFGAGMEGKWVQLGFDVLDDEGDRAQFFALISGLEPVTTKLEAGGVVQPPQGEHMEPTPAQTVANVPFLVKASLQAKFGPGGLGQPVYGEYEAIGEGNEKWPAWIFLRGGLKVKAGNYADFSGVKLFNPTSGEAMADPLPWPDGGGGQPPSMNRLTTADFAAAGWPFEVTPCTPAPGQKFFGLVGYSDFKSGPSVGTETRCQVVDANGAILAGYKVAHAYDSTNHKSETFPSPTGFVLGTGSYIPNGAHPQDLFYVARAGTPDGHAENWPDGFPSDIFRGGMPGQEHFEGRIWWQLMLG